MRDLGEVLFYGVIGALMLAVLVGLAIMQGDCERKGGQLVKNLWGGYDCAKLVEEP